MNDAPAAAPDLPPDRLPTLTEVVLPDALDRAEPAASPIGAVSAPAAWAAGPSGTTALAPAPGTVPPAMPEPARETPAATAPAPAFDADALLADLERRVDLMFEYRVREALAPVLERAVEQVLTEARTELSTSLRAVVARAVQEERRRASLAAAAPQAAADGAPTG